MSRGRLFYVGDFGQAPISDETLRGYSTEFLKEPGILWRRSKTKRDNVARMYEDLATVQRYFWKRDEDRNHL